MAFLNTFCRIYGKKILCPEILQKDEKRCRVKLGYNEQMGKLVTLVHKLTRLYQTKMVGPKPFVITEFDIVRKGRIIP